MRNQMHSFAQVPEANIPRSRFDLSQNVKFTGNAGKLIPFYVQEVLPGDTFDVNTSLVCRLQTLIHPLMDNMYLDTYFFFVPNRLVWDNWKHFCGEANKAWVSDRDWTIPCITRRVSFNSSETYVDFYKDHIVDYMGIGANPACDDVSASNYVTYEINALPIRAYNKIYDDWFRDENLMDPLNIYTGDNIIDGSNDKFFAQDPLRGGIPYDVCKLHDYFTSALPQAQRGNPVSLTTGDLNIPVVTSDAMHNTSGTNYAMHMRYANSATNPITFTGGKALGIDGTSEVNTFVTAGNDSPTTGNAFFPDNLWATGSDINLGITINDLRMAFAVQRWMEKSARGGSRYIEIIKTMFGVDSPDARLQRSEYLGGHRVPINIHQIVNTTETVDTPLGNTGAMSVTSDVHNDFIHSFVEHGHVIGLCCVRYKHSYPQGFDRLWDRRTIFDYYWPSFAYIGEQPILNQEIYVQNYAQFSEHPEVATQVFGYNEAWSDYRYKPNRVMGEMRPGVPNTLASWTLSDHYTDQPILGSTWIKETKAPIDRAISVTSEVADQFLFDVLINNKATRPMPLYSIPGLIDHF